MAHRTRLALSALGVCSMGVGLYLFTAGAAPVAAAQPVRDRSWVYAVLAVGVLALMGGLLGWRHVRSSDWPSTVVIVAVCVLAAGAAVLLLPDRDMVSRAAELGYVVVNAPDGPIRYGPDVRWTVVPFAVGVGLVVSAVAAWSRVRTRGRGGRR